MLSGFEESSGRSLGSTSGIALVLVGPKAMYFVSSAWGLGCSAQLMNFRSDVVGIRGEQRSQLGIDERHRLGVGRPEGDVLRQLRLGLGLQRPVDELPI